MPDGDPLPEEIVLNIEEARVVYLALLAAIDALGPGEERERCLGAQRILVVKYLPDLPELGEA